MQMQDIKDAEIKLSLQRTWCKVLRRKLNHDSYRLQYQVFTVVQLVAWMYLALCCTSRNAFSYRVQHRYSQNLLGKAKVDKGNF